jgi:HK97 family phage prohead protease
MNELMPGTERYTAAYIKSIKANGEIEAWASRPTLDREREIIKASAWMGGGLDDFKRHPVLLASHQYQNFWIGRVTSIEAKKTGLYFTAKFADTAEGREAEALVRSTEIAAFSVGFKSVDGENMMVGKLEAEERKSAIVAGLKDSDSVYVHKRANLYEISLCSVPCLSTALLIGFKKGQVKTKGLLSALAGLKSSEITFDFDIPIKGAGKPKR